MSETPASRLPPCSTSKRKGTSVTLFQHRPICESVKQRYTALRRDIPVVYYQYITYNNSLNTTNEFY